MGRRAGLNLWLVRAVFGGIVLAAVAAQLGAGARPRPVNITMEASRAVLDRAGYRVVTTNRSWMDGHVVAQAMLTARHSGCREPITVRQMTPGAAPEPNSEGVAPILLFGDWQGRRLSRAVMVEQIVAIQARYLMSWYARPRPSNILLSVTDPSGCLALAPVDWRTIWYG